MEVPLRSIELPNGLNFRFFDRTKHYFGGFYHVKIEVCSKIIINSVCCTFSELQLQAASVLGDSVRYSKILGRMGVLESEIQNVRGQLMSQFIESSYAYLATPSFPSVVILKELEKIQKMHKITPSF